MGGKNKAPKVDQRIGQAALMSAQTGRDYLAMMREQAAISNQWAAEDREWSQGTFRPLQDQYVADAKDWTSPDRIAARVGQSEAAALAQISNARDQNQRMMAASGVAPNSGRAAALADTSAIREGLAVAGVGNSERRAVQAEGEGRILNAINMGAGYAVNPATSLGLSNNAYGQGFQGAMAGYGQSGRLLGLQQDLKNQQWQMNQNAQAGMLGGIGQIAGMAFGGGFMSDEDAKMDKKPVGRSLLKAVEKMPVEEWTYKPGMGDGGRHVGTYAQDFQKQTGMGDGKSINIIDALGTTMGAIKELSAKVSKLEGGGRSIMPREWAVAA